VSRCGTRSPLRALRVTELNGVLRIVAWEGWPSVALFCEAPSPTPSPPFKPRRRGVYRAHVSVRAQGREFAHTSILCSTPPYPESSLGPCLLASSCHTCRTHGGVHFFEDSPRPVEPITPQYVHHPLPTPPSDLPTKCPPGELQWPCRSMLPGRQGKLTLRDFLTPFVRVRILRLR
jgi:hypothetical protein